MKLSEHMKLWRTERPDEYIMDNFIMKAVELENGLSPSKSECDKCKFYRQTLEEDYCPSCGKFIQ